MKQTEEKKTMKMLQSREEDTRKTIIEEARTTI